MGIRESYEKAYNLQLDAMTAFQIVYEAEVLRWFAILRCRNETPPLQKAQLLCFLKKLRPGQAEVSVDRECFHQNSCDANLFGLEEYRLRPLPVALRPVAEKAQMIAWDFFTEGRDSVDLRREAGVLESAVFPDISKMHLSTPSFVKPVRQLPCQSTSQSDPAVKDNACYTASDDAGIGDWRFSKMVSSMVSFMGN